MIAAILRAQFLSMRMFRFTAGRRAAVFSAITSVVWYGLWSVVAWGTYRFAREAAPPSLAAALPWGFLLMAAYWQLAPALSASLGATLDFRKLLVYPVPHRKLFTVELLLRLATAGEMLLVLAGGGLGVVTNRAAGGPAALPGVAAAVAAFTAFNVLLGSGLRSLLERLLSRRHVREVVILLLVIATALPRLYLASGMEAHKLERYLGGVAAMAWPWGAAAALGTGVRPLEALAILSMWVALAGLFGRWQFERNLRFDPLAAQATAAPDRPGKSAWAERLYRLPGLLLGDPLGAIVEKELRSLGRTPRFRMVFTMGFTFGILFWLPITMGRHAGGRPALGRHFLVVVSVYALTLLGQVSYWNAFGFDRSAAQMWFSAPVPLARTLVGKNIAAMVFIYLEMAAVLAVAEIVRVRVPPELILETVLVVGIAALYLLALGNLSSVHFPRAMSPERVSQGGASSRIQALVFVFYPLALLPVILAYLARYTLGSETIFALLLAVAGIMGGVVYRTTLHSAAASAVARREELLAELSRGQGPVVE